MHVLLIVAMLMIICVDFCKLCVHSRYVCICISYNTGKSTLPDIYAQCPKACSTYTLESKCVYIRQSMNACVLTNMLHFWHYNNLPKPEVHCSASLYSNRHWQWLWKVFLNQGRTSPKPACAGFLKLILCRSLVCVFVCVCVSAPEAINKYCCDMTWYGPHTIG